MNYVFLGLFIIISSLHLYASFKRNQPFRNATKGMIILSLIGFYGVSVTEYSWFIIVALLLNIAGDLLLIPKNKTCVFFGGICFGLANISYILEFASYTSFPLVPLWFIILIILVYLFFIIVVMFFFKNKVSNKMIVVMFLYLFFNGLLNAFSWFMFYQDPCIYNLLISIGTLIFFTSDCLLYSVRFNKKTIFKSHFFVMLTYVIGQFLIILGIILK